MKVILILPLLVAVANAGVGIPGPAEIQEAMDLWQRHCSGASEGGSDGQTFIYCKRSREGEITREANHELNVTPQPAAPRQVIFVQPPAYTYQHRVVLKGGPNPTQQTRIYVLPGKANHQVQYDDKRTAGAAAGKPQLFFLSDQSFGGGSGDQNNPGNPSYQGNSGNSGGAVASASASASAQSSSSSQSSSASQGQPQQQGNSPIAVVAPPPFNYRTAPRIRQVSASQLRVN